MTTPESGLLVFVEEPAAAAARWTRGDLPVDAAGSILAALQHDLLTNLGGNERLALYLASARRSDGDYAAALAGETGVRLLNVPEGSPLQRWDSALSILYNGCGHRKVLCADGHVPDLYAEDISRAQGKLDLYEMVVGRESGDGCWLIGMNGYRELVGQAEARGEDLLHPLLEVAARAGIKVSVLDTKNALESPADLRRLRTLARGPRHPRLRSALEGAGLSTPRAAGD